MTTWLAMVYSQATSGGLAAVLEGPRVLPHLDEHLLDHILGGLGLPEAKGAKAHQRGGVHLVQRLQGTGIARAQGGNEGGQVGRLGRHRAARSRCWSAGRLCVTASIVRPGTPSQRPRRLRLLFEKVTRPGVAGSSLPARRERPPVTGGPPDAHRAH